MFQKYCPLNTIVKLMTYLKSAAILITLLLWIVGGAFVFCRNEKKELAQNTFPTKSNHHAEPIFQPNNDSWMPYHFDESNKNTLY